ncbi:MAG: hypothetical protein ACI8RD_006985 [Bacillariaceae sp.]|jgi:hypothetical protein
MNDINYNLQWNIILAVSDSCTDGQDGSFTDLERISEGNR